jgi:hypothetical protein
MRVQILDPQLGGFGRDHLSKVDSTGNGTAITAANTKRWSGANSWDFGHRTNDCG